MLFNNIINYSLTPSTTSTNQTDIQAKKAKSPLDLSLKVLNIELDFIENFSCAIQWNDLKKESKSARGFVQSLQEVYYVGTGQGSYNPLNLIKNSELRLKFTKTSVVFTHLTHSTLSYIGSTCPWIFASQSVPYAQLVNLVGSAFKVAKVTHKIFAFEAAFTSWIQLPSDASEATLNEARLKLSSAALNLGCELTKAVLLLEATEENSALVEKINAIASTCAAFADGHLFYLERKKEGSSDEAAPLEKIVIEA